MVRIWHRSENIFVAESCARYCVILPPPSLFPSPLACLFYSSVSFVLQIGLLHRARWMIRGNNGLIFYFREVRRERTLSVSFIWAVPERLVRLVSWTYSRLRTVAREWGYYNWSFFLASISMTKDIGYSTLQPKPQLMVKTPKGMGLLLTEHGWE